MHQIIQLLLVIAHMLGQILDERTDIKLESMALHECHKKQINCISFAIQILRNIFCTYLYK